MTTPLKYPVPEPPTPTKFELASPRGAKLATRVWAVNRPKALVLIVHGGGWHSGYFTNLAKYLNEQQIFVASFDQINAGYSQPEPDAPEGYMHFQEFGYLVEDIFAAIEWAQKEAGNTELPLFLLGESFGGVQVLSAAYEAQERGVTLAGVITSGGLIRINAAMLPPQPVISVLCFIAKYYPRLKMPATDFESTFDEAFGDKEWARTARNDPKISLNIPSTIAAATGTVSTGEILMTKAAEFPTKLLCVHGSRDCRTDPNAIQEFVDKVGPTKATIHMIDTDGHQLFQDQPDIVQDVMNKIAVWIKATTDSK